jgi:hypothetical protein
MKLSPVNKHIPTKTYCGCEDPLLSGARIEISEDALSEADDFLVVRLTHCLSMGSFKRQQQAGRDNAHKFGGFACLRVRD